MGVRVAFPAENKGLPPSGSHDLLVQIEGSPLFLQIGEFADVMHLHLICGFADLAPLRLQSLDQLRAGVEDQRLHLVDEDCVLLPLEWDAAEGRYQWLLAFAPDDKLYALPGASDGLCLRR